MIGLVQKDLALDVASTGLEIHIATGSLTVGRRRPKTGLHQCCSMLNLYEHRVMTNFPNNIPDAHGPCASDQ